MRKLIVKFLGVCLNVTAPIVPKWNGKVAFKLLCRVRRVGISARGKQFLATARSEYMDIDGAPAVLHRWGKGSKSILFLHGWMSNSQRWQPYIDQVDLEEYTVYALDAPGHGMAKGNQLTIEMYRKAVVRTIENSGTIDALVCHSLGSLVGAYAFLHNTSIPIKKYVIMGAPSGMDAIFAYFQELLGLSSATISNLDRVVNRVLKVPHQEITMGNFFTKVTHPVLVVHDKSDVITPHLPIAEALDLNAKVQRYITNGLKHDLKSDAVFKTVLAFIMKDTNHGEERYSA
ncbi:MAG: alpha/beta hydrolase [Marinirhabdus sp.]|nr:alpha/beta hydrolase [Marinirhabdus sp.]